MPWAVGSHRYSDTVEGGDLLKAIVAEQLGTAAMSSEPTTARPIFLHLIGWGTSHG